MMIMMGSQIPKISVLYKKELLHWDKRAAQTSMVMVSQMQLTHFSKMKRNGMTVMVMDLAIILMGTILMIARSFLVTLVVIEPDV